MWWWVCVVVGSWIGAVWVWIGGGWGWIDGGCGLLNWWWLWVVKSVSMAETCLYRCGLGCFSGARLFRWCLGFSFSGWAFNWTDRGGAGWSLKVTTAMADLEGDGGDGRVWRQRFARLGSLVVGYGFWSPKFAIVGSLPLFLFSFLIRKLPFFCAFRFSWVWGLGIFGLRV